MEYVQDCEKRLQQQIEQDKAAWRVERHKQVLENVCVGFEESETGDQSHWEDIGKDESASEDEEMGLDEQKGFIEDKELEYSDEKTDLKKGDGGNYDPSYVKVPNASAEYANELDRRQRKEAIDAVNSKEFQKRMTADMRGVLRDGDFPGARPGARDATALVKKKPK